MTHSDDALQSDMGRACGSVPPVMVLYAPAGMLCCGIVSRIDPKALFVCDYPRTARCGAARFVENLRFGALPVRMGVASDAVVAVWNSFTALESLCVAVAGAAIFVEHAVDMVLACRVSFLCAAPLPCASLPQNMVTLIAL